MINFFHFRFHPLSHLRLLGTLILLCLGGVSSLIGQNSPIVYQILGPYEDYPDPFYVRTFVNFIVEPGAEWIDDVTAANRAQATMDYLNAIYNKHEIYFINSSDDCSSVSFQRVFNTSSLGTVNSIRAEIPGAVHNNALDIYVFSDAFGADGSAFSLPSTYCEVRGLNEDGIPASESETLIHEIGHCLGLTHIFHGTNGNEGGCDEELITQCSPSGASPCFCCGDYVCDTPIVSSSFLNLENDCSNSINFPNLPIEAFRNFMAYTGPRKCRDRFTEGQAQRMRAYLATAPDLEDIQTKSVSIPGGTLLNPSGNIIIEPGDFTIDSPLEMLPGATIRVKPGAILRVKSTITAACGKMWQGVIVEGTGFSSQTPGNQGKVVVSGNGVIEHAKCAINVQNLGVYGEPIIETGGGIVGILGGQLLNNTVGVKFGSYQFFSPAGQPVANESLFLFADFFITDDYRGGSAKPTLMDVTGIVSLKVRNCEFKDLRTQNCTSSFTRAIGIDSKNAGLYISYCQFENLDIGLRADELSLGTGSFSVSNSAFTSCYTGIYSKMTSSFSIVRNNFEVKKPDVCPAVEGLYIRGVHVNGNTSGFTFSDNNFFNNEPDTPVEYLIGTDCMGLGEGMNNKIFRNSYSGLTVGNRASGYNGEEEDGLLYLCNINQNSGLSVSDFIVEEGGTIKSIQSGKNISQEDIPTGNQFSNIIFNFENKNLNHSITYYYYGNEPLEDPDGGTGSLGIIPVPVLESTADCGEQDPCPPPCQDVTEVALWKSGFQQNKQSKSTKEAEYATITDPVQKEIIGNEIIRLQLEMNKDSRRILMQYSLDTTTIALDSIYRWHILAATYPSDLRLAKHFFFTKDFTSFDQLWPLISIRHELSGADLVEFDELGKVYATIRPHLEAGISLDRLPTSTIDSLQFWGDWCLAPGFLAQNILWRNGIKTEPDCSNIQYFQAVGGDASENTTLDRKKMLQAGEKSLQIFPNPARESITIVLPDNAARGRILILDIHGKIVLEQVLSDDSAQVLLSINHLTPGIYFLEVRTTQGKVRRQKLIIAH